MILSVFLIIGLLIGMLRGGGLSGLVNIRLRGVWLIFIALPAELSISLLPDYAPSLFPGILPVLQSLRYLPLVLFGVLNAKNWRVVLVGLGFLCNFTVIMLNGWKMPVYWGAAAIQLPRMEYTVMQGFGTATMWPLADIVPVFSTKMYASVGDIVQGLGVLLLVQHAMVRYSIGKHAKGSYTKTSGIGSVITNHPIPQKQSDNGRHLSNVMSRQPGNPAVGDAKPVGIGFLPLHGPFPASEADDSGQTSGYPAMGNPGSENDRKIPVRLNPRLETIANMIGQGTTVADVGCDHGKLSAYLALRGSPKVIALDISPKSLAKAKLLSSELGLADVIQARVSDGLKKVRPGEADVIVMAGMGGPAICAMLDAGQAVAYAAKQLVLQPMNAVGTVRQWLHDNGFRIADEQLAEEDARIYQIIAAVPGEENHPPMSLFDLEVGYRLIDGRHPLLPKLLRYKMETIDTILAEIAEQATPKAQARRSELIELRGRCEEVYEWIAR